MAQHARKAQPSVLGLLRDEACLGWVSHVAVFIESESALDLNWVVSAKKPRRLFRFTPPSLLVLSSAPFGL